VKELGKKNKALGKYMHEKETRNRWEKKRE
jgi:hypothetical protein